MKQQRTTQTHPYKIQDNMDLLVKRLFQILVTQGEMHTFNKTNKNKEQNKYINDQISFHGILVRSKVFESLLL